MLFVQCTYIEYRHWVTNGVLIWHATDNRVKICAWHWLLLRLKTTSIKLQRRFDQTTSAFIGFLKSQLSDGFLTVHRPARATPAKTYYNIARTLVLSKSYWAIMNKIFMYARPCSIKWRVQFHFSCKISVEFSARSFCLSFGNVKIILSNPNPTSSYWLLSGKDVYFNVSILTLFVSIFIEYLYFVWLRCSCERKS